MVSIRTESNRSIRTFAYLCFFLAGCAKDQSRDELSRAVVDRGARDFTVIDSLKSGYRDHDIVFASYTHYGFALFERVNGRLLVASRESDSVRAIGRTGSGPGEYRSVVDAAWIGNEVIVVDALRRLATVYDTTGAPRGAHRLEGGARRVLARNAMATLVAGRFMRSDRPDTVDAVLRLDSIGAVTRHVPLPFPTDPSGRRFSDIYVGECGEGQFAAVRADTNIVWIVDATTLDVVRTISLAIQFAAATRTQSPEKGADPDRFRFAGLLGGRSGCVIVSPRDVDGDHPKLELLKIGAGQSEVDQFTVPLLLPVAFHRDTLFALDAIANTGTIRILAAELKR